MPKIIKIAKSSWQLGWFDGLERQVGRNLVNGVDAQAYRRGVERAEAFRKAVSAQVPRRRPESSETEAAE